MKLSSRVLIAAPLALMALAGCTVNTAPPATAVAVPPPEPSPVVVQPAPPPPGTVVVQPRTY